MRDNITVSACVVTYNDKNQIAATVKSVAENTQKYPLNFYVIDNASTDGTADFVESLGQATVLRNTKNLGFGAAHNKVLTENMGKYHFVINPDISFNTDVLSDMVDFFESHPDVVMAMPRILNPDGSEQKLPKERPTFKRLYFGRFSNKIRSKYAWADKDITEPCEINFCTGCFFCIRTDIFKKLCGFDERYFMYLEDADLTLMAKRKGKVMMLPQLGVTHAWGRESSKSIKYLLIHIISSFKFLFKWRGKFL